MSIHKLNDTWVLWYHSLRNKNWSKESYIKCGEISSIEEMWQYLNNLHPFKNSMFFLMRKGIFPKWEEPENINGGSWSLSISDYECKETWKEFVMSICGETLVDSMTEINGISISYKGKYSIFKIWIKECNNKNMLFNKSFRIKWKSKKFTKHIKN